MRNFKYILLVALMGIVMMSCENDDTDMAGIIAQYQEEPVEIELDYSALVEEAEDAASGAGFQAHGGGPLCEGGKAGLC